MSTSTMPPREPTTARRWSARVALVAFAAAVVLLLAGAGTQTLRLLLLIAAGCALVLVGLWLFASRRGAMRLLGAALAVGSVIAMLAIDASHGLLWLTIGCIALLVASLAAARSALRTVAVIPERDERSDPPPSHAFLIMNPRSGGGKVDRFHLREEAERLGAEVALLHHGDDRRCCPRPAGDRGRRGSGRCRRRRRHPGAGRRRRRRARCPVARDTRRHP